MVGEVVLDFANADVHPAANDDVFGSAGHAHIAVVGHHPEIAGLRQAVRGEQGRGLFGIGEVFDHVGRAAVGDVALGAAGHLVPCDIDDLYLCTRHRRAVRCEGPRHVVIDRTRGGDQVFAAPVEAEHLDVGKLCVGPLDDRGGDRRARTYPQPQRGQVVALRVVFGQQPVQERRGGNGCGAAEALNLVDAAGRIPLGHQMCRRPSQQRHQHAGDEPGGVGDG